MAEDKTMYFSNVFQKKSKSNRVFFMLQNLLVIFYCIGISFRYLSAIKALFLMLILILKRCYCKKLKSNVKKL